MKAARWIATFGLATTGLLCAETHAQSQVPDLRVTGGPGGTGVTITGTLPYSDKFQPEIVVSGSVVRYYAGAYCMTFCPATFTGSYEMPLWGLPAGTYSLEFYWSWPEVPGPPAVTTTFTLAAATPLPAVTGLPKVVPAFEATNVAIAADGFPLFRRARVFVEGTTINIGLHDGCEAPSCGPLLGQSYTVTLPALPPGNYEVVVRPVITPESLLGLERRIPLKVGESNYQGIWWASPAGIESGWGLQIAHQGKTLFATWYTYDSAGNPMWFAMPDVRRTSPDSYSGAAYRARALPSQAAFNLKALSETIYAGTASFEFTDPDNGTFSYQVDGKQATKRITRQVFSASSPNCIYGSGTPSSTNFQDLWWNAPAGSESGWGVQLAHQGNVIFATIFGYDAQGDGRWLVMPDARETSPGVYAGSVYSTHGPALDANPWRPEDIVVRPEGRGELAFSGSMAGTLTISTDHGTTISLQKSVTRQQFADHATVCQ